MAKQDVHAAFISEFPHDVAAPAGWSWKQVGSTQVCTHHRYDLFLAVDAWEHGPSIRLWLDRSEAAEHRRDYDWADPALLDKMERWIRWLSVTWAQVAEWSAKNQSTSSKLSPTDLARN